MIHYSNSFSFCSKGYLQISAERLIKTISDLRHKICQARQNLENETEVIDLVKETLVVLKDTPDFSIKISIFNTSHFLCVHFSAKELPRKIYPIYENKCRNKRSLCQRDVVCRYQPSHPFENVLNK